MDKLLNNAPCGFLVFSNDGEIVEINATLLGMLGYERQELQGIHVRNLLPVAGRIFYQTHLFPLLKLQGKIEEIYLSLLDKAGAEIPVLVNAVSRESGESVYYDCVFVVIRRRNEYEDLLLKAKKEAEAANQSKEGFLSMVSHDLRTPLNAILGWTQILKDKSDKVEIVKKAVQTIDRSARAQKQLIEDILDFTRSSSGKLRIETSIVDLVEVIKNAVDIITPAAEAKGVRIQSSLNGNGVIMGDGGRIQQVLWNLLSNAVKFTPKDGRVEVGLSPAGSNIEIRVSDTGKGISPNFLPYVFERFRQQDDANTPSNIGLGLGLAITRQIIELHGGTIYAESPGENKGATFIISLPAHTVD